MNKKPERDSDLFQNTLKDVIPLKDSGRIANTPKPRKAKVYPASAHACIPDNLCDRATADTAPTEFLRDGLNRMTLRKLRRGTWPPQDSLDLHGLSTEAARRLVVEFLHHSIQRRFRCVNVIHGKGWRSEGRDGILKVMTRDWLMQHAQVLAFCEAPAREGGAGAVWVLLKHNPPEV